MIKKLFTKKRGQLTLFIIIGIMMLLSSAMVFYIKDRIANKESFEDLVGDIPMEVAPVKEFVEKCMYDLGKQAIILIGENGGYVYEDAIVDVTPNNPTESEGIEIMEGTGVVIPYWYYLEGSDECQTLTSGECYFTTGYPPAPGSKGDPLSMENQRREDNNMLKLETGLKFL